MNRKLFNGCTWLLWLALPLTALRFWQLWDSLPPVMATHFAASGQPNGWMPREQFFWFSLKLIAIVVAVASVLIFLSHRKVRLDFSSWTVLLFFYVMTGFVAFALDSTLKYNVSGQPIPFGKLAVAIPVIVIAFIALFLFGKRGAPLPPSDVIAEEVHGSALWGMVLLAPLVGFLWLANRAPNPGLKALTGLLGLMFIAIAASAWLGFHYYFTRQGLEIRTLGFRLKSIPSAQIERYSVASWNPLGGYGIRGIGDRRAYVWGNKGVWINTSQGKVFLGHGEPERLVRDLDTMMKFSHL
jgi:uncharacterized protein DUF1648